uniref:Uncharacterized protein n=1 Tax=Maylandia zebra TaxID=106582 RepID=A0A3P9BAJ7_9CICH
MALSGDEPICPKFQPNIFDPSRCHDCLRQRHLHAGAGESTEVTQQQISAAESGAGAKTGIGYVYTAKIFSLAYLHALHVPHVFCDSP